MYYIDDKYHMFNYIYSLTIILFFPHIIKSLFIPFHFTSLDFTFFQFLILASDE